MHLYQMPLALRMLYSLRLVSKVYEETLYKFKEHFIVKFKTKTFSLQLHSQIDSLERRSRRDMSPQGRKRVAGMVSRDYQTVSGVGGTQSYPHQVRTNCSLDYFNRLINSIYFSHNYNEEVRQCR